MNPINSDVHWFQLWTGPALHPWAFKDGDPSRRIAALEMLGTLILIFHFLARRDAALLHFPLEQVTDNQGNVYSLLNGKSKEFPSAAFLMQIVLLLYEAGAHLCPSHRKRDFNQWADELTHPDPQGSTPQLQLDVSSFSLLQTILPQWPFS